MAGPHGLVHGTLERPGEQRRVPQRPVDDCLGVALATVVRCPENEEKLGVAVTAVQAHAAAQLFVQATLIENHEGLQQGRLEGGLRGECAGLYEEKGRQEPSTHSVAQ